MLLNNVFTVRMSTVGVPQLPVKLIRLPLMVILVWYGSFLFRIVVATDLSLGDVMMLIFRNVSFFDGEYGL